MFKFGYCVGIFVVTFVFVVANVSERYIGNAVHKDYPGMCYYKDTQTPIAVNTTYKPKSECAQIYCRDDFVIHINYCQRYMLGDGCVVTRKEGVEYPECCPEVKC